VSASGPLILFVAELLRRPGTRRAERIDVVLDGLAISTAQVDEGVPVDVDVIVESLSSSIVVAGTVSAPWTGPCRRCLGDAHGVTRAEVREIFEARPTEGETYPLTGDHIDLEPMVRDAVLLSLPLAPLCADDCRGPAPEVVEVVPADTIAAPASGGPAEPDAAPGDPSDGDGGPPGDPRWAALDDLRFD
jgi:uncharacterized protein